MNYKTAIFLIFVDAEFVRRGCAAPPGGCIGRCLSCDDNDNCNSNAFIKAARICAQCNSLNIDDCATENPVPAGYSAACPANYICAMRIGKNSYFKMFKARV